jgi:hypothetical protein
MAKSRQHRDLRAPVPVVAPRGEIRLEKVKSDGFLDRLSARVEGRKVATPAKALAQIEKLETVDVTELGVAVFVWPSHLRRVTGFEVACEEHGSMPFLAPSKAAAELAAKRHVLHEHRGAGTVVLTDRPHPVKPKPAEPIEVLEVSS